MTGPSGPARSACWRPYTQMKTAPPALEVERTEGSRIFLRDGRVLVDGIASWWTAAHGYNHPYIREAVARQLERMPHVMFGGLTHAPAETLARRLVARLPAPLEHVFFTESGSVAVEVALKIATQGFLNVGRPEKRRFLSFRGAYHGDTFATMALSDPDDGMHARMRAFGAPPVVAELPRTDAERARLEALLAARHWELAAMIVEPRVQAAGGFHFHGDGVLRCLRDLCDRFDIPLVFDEIAVGFGRTGDLFACVGAGVTPDIVTLSKALTGGTLPLAATVASRALFDRFLSDDPSHALMHGPTYMANPLACAAANASLDLFEREPRLEQARALERGLEERLGRLRRHPRVVDVRVLGAIGVVELDGVDDREGLRRRLWEGGAWIRPLGRCVYLMPALTIAADELDLLARAVERALT